MRVAGAAAREREPRHRGDARQRFAAKAEARDALEIAERGDLARRVARERKRQFFARDPAAVVGDLDHAHAACSEVDGELARARVETVFEQLFQCGRRPVDDLTGRDLIDEKVGQYPDCGHVSL